MKRRRAWLWIFGTIAVVAILWRLRRRCTVIDSNVLSDTFGLEIEGKC